MFSFVPASQSPLSDLVLAWQPHYIDLRFLGQDSFSIAFFNSWRRLRFRVRAGGVL